MRKTISVLLVFLLIFPSALLATDYHVAKTGNNGNNGTSLALAKSSIAAGAALLGPGDTLYIHVGIYTEAFDGDTIPPGTSWAAPVKLSAYCPAGVCEAVTIRPNSGNSVFTFGNVHGNATKYIWIYGMTLDAINVDNGAAIGDGTGTGAAGEIFKITDNGVTSAHHIRIESNVIKNGAGNGILAQSITGGIEILRNEIVDNALNPNIDCNGESDPSAHCPGHGVYFAVANSIMDGNVIHDNGRGPFSSAMQTYGSCCSNSNNVFRNNVVYNHPYGNGFIFAHGDNNQAYNNVFYGDSNISIGFGSTNMLFYNNVVTGSTGYPIVITNATGTKIRNNILWNNGTNDVNLADSSDGSPTINNNLCANTGGGSPRCILNTNPLFENLSGKNFHLTATSPAIGTGVNLSSIFTDDKDGNARTLPWTLGPYVYSSEVGGETAPPHTGTISGRVVIH